MGLVCPPGFAFTSYDAAVSGQSREKPGHDIADLSPIEAYFGSILASHLSANEKLALLWCYAGQCAEKKPSEVESILNTVQVTWEKLGGEPTSVFPLVPTFYAAMCVVLPSYVPNEAISLGAFAAFTVYVPEICQFLHGNYSIKRVDTRVSFESHEFEVYKFLRSLQSRLRETPCVGKSDVLQRGLGRFPGKLKTALRRRLASNEAPISQREYRKWLSTHPGLGAAKIPRASLSPRSVIDRRTLEVKKRIDEAFQFCEELRQVQTYNGTCMTQHLQPLAVGDVLARYGVIPVEVAGGLELCGIKTLTEGAFLQIFAPPSLWENDPACALDLLGNFRRAVLQESMPISRPRSAPAAFSSGFICDAAESNVECPLAVAIDGEVQTGDGEVQTISAVAINGEVQTSDASRPTSANTIPALPDLTAQTMTPRTDTHDSSADACMIREHIPINGEECDAEIPEELERTLSPVKMRDLQAPEAGEEDIPECWDEAMREIQHGYVETCAENGSLDFYSQDDKPRVSMAYRVRKASSPQRRRTTVLKQR